MPFLKKTFNKTFLTQKFVGFSASLDFSQTQPDHDDATCSYWGEAIQVGRDAYDIYMVIEGQFGEHIHISKEKLEMPPLTREQALDVLSFMEERFLTDEAIVDVTMPEEDKKRRYYKRVKPT